ncbi:MAG: hypothetical protein FWG10_04200, partial [Eubacteriaceae bacterium]|nr:hypothetical protein [Eubacteriaceae bacterium]
SFVKPISSLSVIPITLPAFKYSINIIPDSLARINNLSDYHQKLSAAISAVESFEFCSLAPPSFFS